MACARLRVIAEISTLMVTGHTQAWDHAEPRFVFRRMLRERLCLAGGMRCQSSPFHAESSASYAFSRSATVSSACAAASSVGKGPR